MIVAEGIISGLLVGCVYALIGAGMSIIYGVMRVVNFAHGDFLVFSSFLAYWLHTRLQLDPISSLLIVVPVSFLFGVLLYYLIIPRLQQSDDPESASFLAFFGMSLMLTYAMNQLFGATPRGIGYPYEALFSASTQVGPLFLSTSRIIATAAAVAVIALLILFLFQTHYGKAIRALIQNSNAAKILGIDTKNVSAISFGIGLGLVSVAGVLITLVFPSISSKLGVNYTTIAFVVIVLGGLRQPLGALLGGVVFGLAESITSLYMPMGYSTVITFVILIVVVMLKPEGLLSGVKVRRKLGSQTVQPSQTAAVHK
ncbi:branched-chain amino acid ABC transporter permease [Brevibacillus marinus]|uniref:branched-chain amino acid ABC transporter permease n=1 Tax=Brevibacillus marinus TaxID=2496837 RepID=UPI000F81B965|nr:branched-chain amino acid ABC transporter permease [Brevibacillus marinus]